MISFRQGPALQQSGQPPLSVLGGHVSPTSTLLDDSDICVLLACMMARRFAIRGMAWMCAVSVRLGVQGRGSEQRVHPHGTYVGWIAQEGDRLEAPRGGAESHDHASVCLVD